MIEYFIEIRRRALHVLLVFSFFFGVFFYLATYLFNFIVRPLLLTLPVNKSLIATTVTGPIFAHLNLAFNFSLLAVIPFFLYQIWRFIYPALHQKELYNVKRVVVCSGFLFSLGVLFSYFLVLPMIFKFLISATPDMVTLMPDINYTIDFIFRMLLVFGLCFQLPLILVMLIRTRVLSLSTMKYYRPHFIVIAFIIGMIFTPPDVFSQVMLALPIVVLYEVGLLFASHFSDI